LLEAALGYAACGWRVFPLHAPRVGGCTCRRRDCDRPAKHPRTEHGLHDATVDSAVVRRWWAQWPEANVGVVTGTASGFWVLDVDVHHGGDDSLADLEHRHDALPETVHALTGGGGRHLLFAHPGVRVPNRI